MLRGAIVLALALAGGPEPARSDETGAAMPPVAVPNRVLDSAGGIVDVVTLRAPDDFEQALRASDAAGVIGDILQVEKMDGDGSDAGVMVLFVDDWDDATRFAEWIGSDLLAGHFAEVAAGTAVSLFQMKRAGGRWVQWVTVAGGLAPYETPTTCYARLVATVLYTGNQDDFVLRRCAESLE